MKPAWRTLFVAMWLSADVCAQDAASVAAVRKPSADAIALVELAQLWETAAKASDYAIEDAVRAGEISQPVATCLHASQETDLTHEFAGALEEFLTPAEINDALEFYRSETGKKLVVLAQAEIRKQFGERAGAVAPLPEITASDDAAFDTFLRTSAGKKVFDSKMLIRAPTLVRLHETKFSAALTRCRANQD